MYFEKKKWFLYNMLLLDIVSKNNEHGQRHDVCGIRGDFVHYARP